MHYILTVILCTIYPIYISSGYDYQFAMVKP